jgi:endoglucanase
MNKDSEKFLYKLLSTPSPTGFEQKIQKVVKERMKASAKTIEIDYHGNLIAALNPKAERKVMLAGHCDQIGFMVKHIDKDGFIYVAPLGGIDSGVVPGAHVTICGKKGYVNGIFGRKPIHHQPASERERMSLKLDKMWIDIGAKDKKDAEKQVAVGDCATYKLGVTELGQDFISAAGLDDRVGLFVAMEALRLCARSKLQVGLFSVSTVQEEVGLRGARTAAYGIDPDVGIAIDVTFASDNPGCEDKHATPCVLGKGPGIYTGPNINPVVQKMLVDCAKAARIPHQILPSSRLLGNDANAMQITRNGVAAASIGIPNRYMHTQVEVCSKSDLTNSAKLLAAFVKKITPRTDLRPR